VPSDGLRAVQAHFDAERTAPAVEHLFGNLARRLKVAGFTRFIIAGGETSSAITQALEIDSFTNWPANCTGRAMGSRNRQATVASIEIRQFRP